MRWISPLLLLWLAITLIPGTGELLQDAAHLVFEGRTDHVDGHDPCPEHGCTPIDHHCSCCSSLVAVQRGEDPLALVTPAPRRVAVWPPAGRGARGFSPSILRPPAA